MDSIDFCETTSKSIAGSVILSKDRGSSCTDKDNFDDDFRIADTLSSVEAIAGDASLTRLRILVTGGTRRSAGQRLTTVLSICLREEVVAC